jgi:3-hydroxyisobutyrate dehydrogenase-like beta-hydroxyacid dehydrogenase
MAKVGFIGLGNMGLGMARNIAAAGWPLAVWNRSREKLSGISGSQVSPAKSPAAAADGAEFVVTMVADDAALEAVTLGSDGLLASLGPEAVHVSMSTVSVEGTRNLAARHRDVRRQFLAAPVFGRPEAAAAAKLWICAAGPKALVERCRPLFELMGQGIVHFGETPEQANVVKLAGNFLIVSMLESLCESFTLLRKHGIDPNPFYELIAKNLFRSPIYENYGRLALAGQFEPPGFKLVLGLKDMSLALQAAQDSKTPMPALSVAHGNLLSGVARGFGDLDMTALIRVIGENAGLTGDKPAE